jgi:hypothetical protein
MAGPLAGPTMQSVLALGHEPGVVRLALGDAGRHLVLRRHDQLEGDGAGLDHGRVDGTDGGGIGRGGQTEVHPPMLPS